MDSSAADRSGAPGTSPPRTAGVRSNTWSALCRVYPAFPPDMRVRGEPVCRCGRGLDSRPSSSLVGSITIANDNPTSRRQGRSPPTGRPISLTLPIAAGTPTRSFARPVCRRRAPRGGRVTDQGCVQMRAQAPRHGGRQTCHDGQRLAQLKDVLLASVQQARRSAGLAGTRLSLKGPGVHRRRVIQAAQPPWHGRVASVDTGRRAKSFLCIERASPTCGLHVVFLARLRPQTRDHARRRHMPCAAAS
jgi:hypothetical protein